ncbi:MAG: molecular chaperone DnaJ [Gammaproteobacteria bacterium]|nr:molecular chaperone DnaJ [Gammaproteobacteria bacterium]
MPKSSNSVVHIEGGAKLAKLSPAQKKFNTLIKQIDKQKQRLAAWREAIPHLHRLSAGEYEPLIKTYVGHRAELAHLLDEQQAAKGFTAKQREKMTHLILGICEELITPHGMDELKPLYNKYSEVDFDTEAREMNDLSRDFMKAMFEDGLGIKLDADEIDLDSPEQTAERLRERVEAQQRQAEERYAKRKKTAKQLKREAAKQEEEANMSKSIREVYRQLVTDLHPDREQDPEERKRKTELMQRVTVAYKKKDLLQLLELQLAVEQIDQQHINNIAEGRLKHFNKVLQGQLDQIRGEIEAIEEAFKMNLAMMPFEQLSPQQAVSALRRDIQELHIDIKQIQQDLQRFKEAKHLKAWLKNQRIDDGMDDLNDWPFGGPGLVF